MKRTTENDITLFRFKFKKMKNLSFYYFDRVKQKRMHVCIGLNSQSSAAAVSRVSFLSEDNFFCIFSLL